MTTMLAPEAMLTRGDSGGFERFSPGMPARPTTLTGALHGGRKLFDQV